MSLVRTFVLLAAASLLFQPAAAVAHIGVWPKQSQAGAHERYTVRVPNEKAADTIAIELRFPPGIRVRSFEQKPGWSVEPMRDSSGAMTGARWAGRLAPGQFTEFGLLAINPPAGGELVWAASQYYSDGTRIDWSGPPASKTPAPRVVLNPPSR